MANKNSLLILSAFFLGLIIGSIGISIFLSGHVESNINNLNLFYIGNLESKAHKAYINEPPEVALWALSSLIDIQKALLDEAPIENRTIFSKDLVLSYTRLALTYRKMRNKIQYHENISNALTLAKKLYPSEINNEQDLLNFVQRVDGY